MKYSKTYQFNFLLLILIIFSSLASVFQAHSAPTEEPMLSDAIPIETPYIFGYEPRWRTANQSSASPRVQKYKWQLINRFWSAVNEQVAHLSPRWTDEEKRVWQMVASLPIPKTDEELSQIGFDRPSAFWVYGLGLTPAFIFEVPNPKKLNTWARAHLANREHTFKSVKYHAGTYWRKELTRWVILLRLKGKRLYLSILPKRAEPVLLSYFLRDVQPQSVTQTLRTHFDSLPQGRGSGVINLENMIDLIFGSKRPLLKHSGTSLGLPTPIFKPCEADLRAVGEQVKSITLGLKETDQNSVDVFTHFSLSQPRLTLLEPVKLSSTPLDDLRSSEEYGGIAMRMRFGGLFSALENIGQQWSTTPWTCPLLQSFNQMSLATKLPQWSFIKGLLSPLEGLTMLIHKNNSQDPNKNMSLNFEGWLELFYPSPNFIINLLTNLKKIPKLPADYYLLDGKIRDWTIVNSNLNKPLVSLTNKGIMASLGSWGERIHREKKTDQQSQSTLKLVSSNQLGHPLLWLSLPSDFTTWLQAKLASYRNRTIKGDHSQLPNVQTNTSQRIFRVLSLHLVESGLLLKVTLDTNHF
jgi:hypothetical protein